MKRLCMGLMGGASLWLVAGVLFLGVSLSPAGEAIQFGKEKTKLAPTKDSKLGQEVLKSWKKGGDLLTDEMAIPVIPRLDVVDPKREKMLKLKSIERRNWAFVQPGELQDEEERKMGVPDSDDLMGKEDKEKWMFLDDSKSSKNPKTSTPSQRVQVSGKTAPMAASSKDEDEDFGRALRVSSKADSQSGLHTDRALDFRKLLDPAGGTMRSEKVEETANLFPGGSMAGLSKNQQAMREQYREFVNGPAAMASPASTSLEGPRSSPLNSILNKPSPSPSINYDGPGPISPNMGRMPTPAQGPMNYNNYNMGGVAGYGSLPSPAFTAPSPPPRQSTPISNFEGSRGRGLHTMGGH